MEGSSTVSVSSTTRPSGERATSVTVASEPREPLEEKTSSAQDVSRLLRHYNFLLSAWCSLNEITNKNRWLCLSIADMIAVVQS